MPHYKTNYITQVLIRADFVQGSCPMVGAPDDTLLSLLTEYPLRSAVNRAKNEIRLEKTPQGPVKNTRTIQFAEHNFFTADKSRHVALCSEYTFLECRRYEDYGSLREEFLALTDALAAKFPALAVSRLGMRYINEIKLPNAADGTGLGADFWKDYVNELLLGGLRFAANDGALARQMNSTELNYGSDRATIKYGIFNTEYPKPNRRREFVLDIDTYCVERLTPDAIPARLDAFHTAACSVFETAITDKLRAKMLQ